MAEPLKAGRYQLEQEVGHGGMGRVFRARDTRLGRTVALKMLPAELTDDRELRRRLAQEARAASALNHPGIATVYDFEEQEADSFIVYEFVEGATLRERLQRKPMAPEEVLEIGIQLADALAAAHDRGIIHRDLKPENIMLTPGAGRYPRPKILDFGLAKQSKPLTQEPSPGSSAETAAIATARGWRVGTINYMSPEQVEGEPADARSDLYALGLVLYEMTTGTNPFVGKTQTSTIANILKQDAPSLLERIPAAPAELDRILRKCLRKRAEERYQSARELRVDLANLRQDSAHPSGRPASASTPPSPPLAEHVPSAGAGVFSRGTARGLFIAIQAGYLVMYGFFSYALGPLLGTETPAQLAMLDRAQAEWLLRFWIFAVLAGVPIRLYLLTATTADYVDTGLKFRYLFPVLLVLDTLWSLSPALMTHKLGWLSFPCIAALLYLPFTQRRLLYDAYSPRGGRTSGIRPPGSAA